MRSSGNWTNWRNRFHQLAQFLLDSRFTGRRNAARDENIVIFREKKIEIFFKK